MRKQAALAAASIAILMLDAPSLLYGQRLYSTAHIAYGHSSVLVRGDGVEWKTLAAPAAAIEVGAPFERRMQLGIRYSKTLSQRATLGPTRTPVAITNTALVFHWAPSLSDSSRLVPLGSLLVGLTAYSFPTIDSVGTGKTYSSTIPSLGGGIGVQFNASESTALTLDFQGVFGRYVSTALDSADAARRSRGAPPVPRRISAALAVSLGLRFAFRVPEIETAW